MDQEDKECVITALKSLQEAKAAIQLHIKGLWSCLSTTTPIKEERAEAVDSKLRAFHALSAALRPQSR